MLHLEAGYVSEDFRGTPYEKTSIEALQRRGPPVEAGFIAKWNVHIR